MAERIERGILAKAEDGRITLTADDGYIFTNGEAYGSVVTLAEGVSNKDFYPITLEEYNEIMNAPEELATEEDYQNALKEMGVDL